MVGPSDVYVWLFIRLVKLFMTYIIVIQDKHAIPHGRTAYLMLRDLTIDFNLFFLTASVHFRGRKHDIMVFDDDTSQCECGQNRNLLTSWGDVISPIQHGCVLLKASELDSFATVW